MDFRLKENRREAFIRYWVWQLRTTDCDPALSLLNYVFKRQELNIEQQLWLSWLYGNTYHLPTAYLIWNEFPDYENVDLERLENWNSVNYKRLRYQVDCKWQKGHLPKMFSSYRQAMGSSQRLKFKELCQGTPQANYEILKKFINKDFFKFGRYLSWFYMQTLKSCVGLSIEPADLLFGDSGSGSHRDGMCYVVGKDEWTSRYYDLKTGKKFKRKVKYDEEKVTLLQSEADSIIQEVKERFPDVQPDYFLMETALCSFKKLFRTRQGRYLGYYLDRQAEEIRQVEQDGWDGVDWCILHDYRREELHSDLGRRDARISKQRMFEFPTTGQLRLLSMYEDLRL